MIHHLSKPSYADMMNSLSINNNCNSPSPKMSILQTHMLRPAKCIDQYKNINYVLTNFKDLPSHMLGSKNRGQFGIQNKLAKPYIINEKCQNVCIKI